MADKHLAAKRPERASDRAVGRAGPSPDRRRARPTAPAASRSRRCAASSLTDRGRRVRRDHRPVGLGQVDPDAHPRLPRRADARASSARRRGRRRPRRGPSWPRCATATSASCSSSSTCCRPAAWRNVELPLSTPASTAPSAASGPSPRSSGSAWRPGRPPAGRALRRPAAAGRHRPGAVTEPDADPRRRAHRQPRLDARPPTCSGCSTSSTRAAARSCSSPTSPTSPPAPTHRAASATAELAATARPHGGTGPMNWRDTLRTATRGGPHAPAALGADDARHPHRHHRGDAHRRARPGRQGRRSATRSTSSAPTCSSSRPAAPPTAGVRGGFGSASTLTDQRRRGAASDRPSPPTSPRSRPCPAPPQSLVAGDDQLDHRPSSARRRRGRTSGRGRSPSGRFITARTSRRRRRSSCSAPTRRPSCSAAASPVGQTVTLNGIAARGHRRARAARARRRAPTSNDLGVVPLSDVCRSASSAGRTATRSARST